MELNKVKKRAYIVVSVYIVLLSLMPLISDFQSRETWAGYGWGAYVFDNGIISVRFSEIQYGGDKPKIMVYLVSSVLKPIDFVEVSDHESYIGGFNIYHDCRNLSIKVIDKKTIEFTYEYSNLTLRKICSVPSSYTVNMTYIASTNTTFKISLWRWYYDSIENITFEDMGQNTEIILRNLTSIVFTFHSSECKECGNISGIVVFSKPVDIHICRDSVGINKFVVETNSREFWFHIIIVNNNGIPQSPLTSFFATILSIKGAHFVLPIVATSLVFLGWRRWMRK